LAGHIFAPHPDAQDAYNEARDISAGYSDLSDAAFHIPECSPLVSYEVERFERIRQGDESLRAAASSVDDSCPDKIVAEATRLRKLVDAIAPRLLLAQKTLKEQLFGISLALMVLALMLPLYWVYFRALENAVVAMVEMAAAETKRSAASEIREGRRREGRGRR
jgi:hypothetical protein